MTAKTTKNYIESLVVDYRSNFEAIRRVFHP